MVLLDLISPVSEEERRGGGSQARGDREAVKKKTALIWVFSIREAIP